MSTPTANMLKPIFAALPAEERQAFAEWVQKETNKKLTPKPIKKRKSTRDLVADQLGEEWRPGNEDMLLANILNGR